MSLSLESLYDDPNKFAFMLVKTLIYYLLSLYYTDNITLSN